MVFQQILSIISQILGFLEILQTILNLFTSFGA
jgi:hypothetical protein